MTHLWHTLDANEQAVLVCALTLLVGLFVGAAWAWFAVHPDRRPVTDDLDVEEYRTHADEALAVASDTPIHDDLAVETLRRGLADDEAVGRWLG